MTVRILAVCGNGQGSSMIMKMKVDQDTLKQGQGMVGVQWEFGFWMALVAALAGAVLAFIGLKAPGETRAER